MSNHKRVIKNRYNDLGGRIYDLRYTEEQQKKYDSFLPELNINDGDLVLDNGCGTGLILNQLPRTSVGLDLSPRLLEAALKRTEGLHSIHLVNGDSENLPFKDSVYQIIISVTVIQNVNDPVKMLTEMNRTGSADALQVVTALRKVFTKNELVELFNKTKLKISKIIDNENTNDWIVFSQ
ncbi:MAG: methyltransferase domain-containing protein [Candidatus Bathyarchaeota archaeon]|nr:methyltransferase domain-containing protein [Candidatus Bathyarchaeota archaeon]